MPEDNKHDLVDIDTSGPGADVELEESKVTEVEEETKVEEPVVEETKVEETKTEEPKVETKTEDTAE